MGKNEICTQLSLSEIIKKKIRRETAFDELDEREKFSVLEYIKKHELDNKIFKNKGYDVLSKTFFAYEYILDDNSFYGFSTQKVSFDNLDDFINYVGNDIYDNTCFLGYKFSNDDIHKYSIDKTKLNFEAFINYSIDDYSFEKLQKDEAIDSEERENNTIKIRKYIDKIDSIDSYDILFKKYKNFNSKFISMYSKEIFLSLLLEKFGIKIKDYIVHLFCDYGRDCGIKFADLLYYYGSDIADYVINNYEGPYTIGTRKKRIKEMKEDFKLFLDEKTIMQKKGGFDKYLCLYYVDYRYYNDDNFPFMYHRKYFIEFDSFIKDLDGNICFCDLSKAPLELDELKKYKYNEKTRFPGSKDYKDYIINKIYEDGRFVVEQKWIDYDGNNIKNHSEKFIYFCDFVHYLNGNISNANLIMCDGVENIKELNELIYNDLRVRSDVAKKLGLKLDEIDAVKYLSKDFCETEEYELATNESFLVAHEKDEDYSDQVAYVSDIHLLHRYKAFNCKTNEDIEYVNQIITDTINNYGCNIKLIGGDIASEYEAYAQFINILISKKRDGFIFGDKQFYVLGNHELWSFNGMKVDEIVAKYNTLFPHDRGMYLVHNNLYYLDNVVQEISTEELKGISIEDLRSKLRSAFLIIFGGIGFAGENEKFNANQGIYRDTIDRTEEIRQTTIFRELYEKVVKALYDKNVIIFTHNPAMDWTKNVVYAHGFVYVSGHNHRNYYYDDGMKRIYADNQIGYKQKNVNMKLLSVNMEYDWFSDYKDGIYEIERNDYINFYRGIKEGVTFNREYEKLYMLKHEDVYMFLIRSTKGTLQILNGGLIRSANGHDLDYFYDNMVTYSKSIRLFLSDYDEFQRNVSRDITSIGGSGRIHGSIVDIDFYNHLYLNPLDGTITSYFATSMVDKYVYENLPSLLKKECPNLYLNYEKKHNKTADSNDLIVFNNNLTISNKTIYVNSTEMYKVSRILKGLQFTTKYNIVRLWSDSFVGVPSKEKGKLIVSNIIDPNSLIEANDKKNK